MFNIRRVCHQLNYSIQFKLKSIVADMIQVMVGLALYNIFNIKLFQSFCLLSHIVLSV